MSMELLAPAGGPAALRAAVQSGADAVYLGTNAFGARQSAENFSADELKYWVDYCHLYGVDVHVAVNTLIKNKELPSLVDCVKKLNAARVDALIVQDIGAAEIIKNTVPDMTLHASTQMTVTSLEGVKYLEKMGFSRVVLARELSKDEIGTICRGTETEIEVFVHGAICMCYSGQCLMSSILGGRSGNRGRCAQPCRLPYKLVGSNEIATEGYLLSPKDMALVNELGTLKELGVKSLKIEGRLKRAEYVAAVVGIYRKYLDLGGQVSPRDMRELTDAFSRSGFTDGYFKNKLGKNMMSHTSPGNSADNKFTDAVKERTRADANIRKIPVKIRAEMKEDTPLVVTIWDNNGNSAYAISEQYAERAIKKPLGANHLKDKLLKLGSTPFACTDEDVEVIIDDWITIPVNQINAARNEATNELKQKRTKARVEGRVCGCEILTKRSREATDIILTAEVSDKDQLEAAIIGDIKRIYVPAKVLGTLNNKTLLNRAKEQGTEIVTKASEIFSEQNIETEGALVSSPAAIYRYGDKRLYGDFRLNVLNSRTAEHFSCLETVTLSPELNLGEIRNLLDCTNARAEIIGYGRIPLMTMRNCPVRAAGKCQKSERIYSLRDRKNEEFPILCTEGCRAVLLNSKPIYLADKISDVTNLKISSLRLIFTVENFSQCGKIIEEYKRALAGEAIEPPKENTFTRGHMYRKVL